MKKINVAELLRNCPSGMELDCTIWDSDAKVFFKGVLNDDFAYPIVVTVKYNNCEYSKSFSKYGAFNDLPYCKCVIFPKGKTSWEGFQMPFNDGDIIYKDHFIAIVSRIMPNGLIWFHCWYNTKSKNCKIKEDFGIGSIDEGMRFATEEEKAKLFKAIEDNGYKWNEETKTLEKLIEPKFKVGDKIFNVLRKSMGALGTFQGTISEITDDKYIFTDGSYMFISSQDNYELVPNELEKLVKPEFKIGDIIQNIDAYKVKITEINIGDECYGYESIIAKGIGSIPFNEQGNWKLVQDKFDINTLVPFESRVLARDNEREKWIPAFWGFYDVNSDYPYKLIGCIARYCIPYEGNEHLRGKTDDCNKYFKTWK